MDMQQTSRLPTQNESLKKMRGDYSVEIKWPTSVTLATAEDMEGKHWHYLGWWWPYYQLPHEFSHNRGRSSKLKAYERTHFLRAMLDIALCEAQQFKEPYPSLDLSAANKARIYNRALYLLGYTEGNDADQPVELEKD